MRASVPGSRPVFAASSAGTGRADDPAAGYLGGVIGAPGVLVRRSEQAVQRPGEARRLVEDGPAGQPRPVGVAGQVAEQRSQPVVDLVAGLVGRTGARRRPPSGGWRRRSRARTAPRTPACGTRTSRSTRTCATGRRPPAAPSGARPRCCPGGLPARTAPAAGRRRPARGRPRTRRRPAPLRGRRRAPPSAALAVAGREPGDRAVVRDDEPLRGGPEAHRDATGADRGVEQVPQRLAATPGAARDRAVPDRLARREVRPRRKRRGQAGGRRGERRGVAPSDRSTGRRRAGPRRRPRARCGRCGRSTARRGDPRPPDPARRTGTRRCSGRFPPPRSADSTTTTSRPASCAAIAARAPGRPVAGHHDVSLHARSHQPNSHLPPVHHRTHRYPI